MEYNKNSHYFIESIQNLREDLKSSYYIYYFVGKSGLGDCNNLYRMLNTDMQKNIVHKMQDLEL